MIWKEANKRFDEYGNDKVIGTNGFYAMKAHWSEHPDRDDTWAEAERARIGEERFRREHECEFLIFDETLINSIHLADMEGVTPVENTGQVRWFKRPTPGHTYLTSLDPSMGTGGDFAAIQVFELPTYKQIAEWRHNTTPIPAQIRILKDICNYIKECCSNDGQNIYWSVENNSIGEGALIVIRDMGEENIPGMCVSEPIRKGHVRKFRKGFNTTHSTKISACTRLKNMVENDKLTINSKVLVSELKAFVASGSSFKAKPGETDDLVSACLLSMRIMAVLKDWDPRVYETFNQADTGEDATPPMPIFVSTNIR